MLKIKFIIPALLIVVAGCSRQVRNTRPKHSSKTQMDSLYVVLAVKDITAKGKKASIKFIVHNENPRGKSFCKWHTPYEPLMSKYLDITDEQGNEVSYVGPMAKRATPPPVESYLVVNPEDTIVTDINLLKGYALISGKTYTVSYNSSSISGLKATNILKFKFEN